MVRGVQEAVREEGVLGILKGPLSAASAGTGTAVMCGLAAALAARPRSK
jgi:hypothetical protein